MEYECAVDSDEIVYTFNFGVTRQTHSCTFTYGGEVPVGAVFTPKLAFQ